MNKSKLGVVLVVTMLAFFVAGCGGASPPQPPPPPPASTQPAPPAPPQAADLLLGQTHIERYNDSVLSYQIVATIENAGAGEANGFNAGCTYTCPPGDSVAGGGLDIVQEGYIAGNSSHTYTSPFHLACSAHPPTLVLSCTIHANKNSGPYAVNAQLP